MNFKKLSWSCQPATLILIFSGYSACCNYIFLNKLSDAWFSIAGATAALFFVFIILYSVLLVRPAAKFLMSFFIVGNAAAFYFMKNYGIVIDEFTIHNLAAASANEIRSFLNADFFFFLDIAGLIPVLLLCRTKIDTPPLRDEIKERIFLAAVSFLGLLWTGRHLLPVKENPDILLSLLPTNYILSGMSFADLAVNPFAPRKTDLEGTVNRYWKDNGRKNVFVVILGESARAANFSLYGYKRDTNKALKPYIDDMLVFPPAQACGTQTLISVPCLFSFHNRKDFMEKRAWRRVLYEGNVLDTLAHNGYHVLWRENDYGCFDVCNRITTEEFCGGGGCLDEVLQKDLSQRISEINDNAVIILHHGGSHTPYHKRYPSDFDIFRPSCADASAISCKRQQKINSYDNSIIYTSHLMSRLFEDLKKLQNKYNVIVFYTSDHGESLGEDGIYLHAAPYETAPSYQKEVPFLVWIPEKTRRNMNYDRNCLRRKQKENVSHDNFFHSLLGAAGIITKDYIPSLDIFSGCHK